MRQLVGELNDRGCPMKGTRLNWKGNPLGTRPLDRHGRVKRSYFMYEGETYYDAVERIRWESGKE